MRLNQFFLSGVNWFERLRVTSEGIFRESRQNDSESNSPGERNLTILSLVAFFTLLLMKLTAFSGLVDKLALKAIVLSELFSSAANSNLISFLSSKMIKFSALLDDDGKDASVFEGKNGLSTN